MTSCVDCGEEVDEVGRAECVERVECLLRQVLGELRWIREAVS